jgi:hypothetical protein
VATDEVVAGGDLQHLTDSLRARLLQSLLTTDKRGTLLNIQVLGQLGGCLDPRISGDILCLQARKSLLWTTKKYRVDLCMPCSTLLVYFQQHR